MLGHTHTGGLCSNAMEVRTLSRTDDKSIWRCSVYPSRSQISTVMVMTITIDSLLSRRKLDYDEGYDMDVKGPSAVVIIESFLVL